MHPPKFGRKMEVHLIVPKCSLPGSLCGERAAVEQGLFFFSYFPPLKSSCLLWSGASYSLKNMVASKTFWLRIYIRHHFSYWHSQESWYLSAGSLELCSYDIPLTKQKQKDREREGGPRRASAQQHVVWFTTNLGTQTNVTRSLPFLS